MASSQSETACLWGLGEKRLFRFCFDFSTRDLTFSSLPLRTELQNSKKFKPYGETTCRCPRLQPQLGSLSHPSLVTDMFLKKPPNYFRPQSFVSSTVFCIWSFGHHKAQTTHPYYALCEFLIQRIIHLIKWLMCYALKFGTICNIAIDN